jgi:hypothetical protein
LHAVFAPTSSVRRQSTRPGWPQSECLRGRFSSRRHSRGSSSLLRRSSSRRSAVFQQRLCRGPPSCATRRAHTVGHG